MTAEDAYRHVNLVEPSFIRVDADEVTYNLHVLIRFELELAIMRDELEVADLPGAWNDAYERRLGIRPSNDAEGVLQDTHWSGGAFGYFPTYTLGTIYSAMLWDRITVDLPDIEQPGGGGRLCTIAGLAARARAPAGITVRGRRADRAGHRQRTGSSPADAVSARQVRSALRPGGRVSDVLGLFLELAAIPSPPGEERAVADVVIQRLRALGVEPDEDGAGAAIGSQIGNIYAWFAPTVEGGSPIFLNAHLDTVPPTAPIRPEVRNGIVVNAEETILGADNKAAVAAMVAAVEQIHEQGIDHAGIELVLTPMEEIGLRGAKEFDVTRLHAGFGYCYDHAAPIGNVVTAAPTQRTLRLRFKGRAAHSGIAPEQGRSAIAAAARAIADMRLGRIDAATTANVGLIQGGIAGNIVPPECTVMAEARSRDPGRAAELAREMLDAATHAANLYECELESTISSEYEGYRFTRAHPAVKLAHAALETCGHVPQSIESGRWGRRQRVQRCGRPVCQSVQRHGRDPYRLGAHFGIRPRGDDGGYACADRPSAFAR